MALIILPLFLSIIQSQATIPVFTNYQTQNLVVNSYVYTITKINNLNQLHSTHSEYPKILEEISEMMDPQIIIDIDGIAFVGLQ